jgi:hypothetical protein
MQEHPMRGRTWQPAKPKLRPKPKLPKEVREAVDTVVAPVVAKLKRKLRKQPKNPRFAFPVDLFTRWHRDALYFVIVMRTADGPPATFEIHAARMDYDGNGKFNFAVPMRRGWNTFKRGTSPAECIEELSELISY